MEIFDLFFAIFVIVAEIWLFLIEISVNLLNKGNRFFLILDFFVKKLCFEKPVKTVFEEMEVDDFTRWSPIVQKQFLSSITF